MLTEIVRPLVRTQIRLLANSSSTRQTLVQTIGRWLSYLGVEAQVTQLDSNCDQIQVALRVKKPQSCDSTDWQKIIDNIGNEGNIPSTNLTNGLTYDQIAPKQQIKLQRLLAYMIQVEQPESQTDWDRVLPLLESLELNPELMTGIRSALKIPQSLDLLVEGLEPDVAAIALEKAVGIALLDRRVNPQEDRALSLLLEAMKRSD
ncbi:MAG: hypothetical protein WAN66_04105 [Limnoraphis robusta]|jgi:hypothetical protein|uniref:Uncharacterized protein n=1 Tax=Limnoraphis robusta CCNP1315 TaxID=3110306 RepID=A0ABU5TYN1_9CYAN|nr:hypothetical protein [Limnoraphis robusta]MEA5499996.1 hypothetical protein [Limnoraphis robusta BA-68 BA1]MEA5520059.1 hypothetical protein [Limnoraphis robusta CCNP1315]MEA5542294.1 hypothetical protein [Limnoraphis robusta Tam1]MEA5548758.1 hypothetical protein [Limnoraphis robusta CCNP1324]